MGPPVAQGSALLRGDAMILKQRDDRVIPSLVALWGGIGRPLGQLSAVLLLTGLLSPLEAEPSVWAEVQRNATAAQEAFIRCHRLMEAWLARRDPVTSLLPQNLNSPVWTPENSAADLWSFLVLTAYFTDRSRFEGLLREILRHEIVFTTRMGRLPDAFSFSTHRFLYPEPDLSRLIFGASEYAKDGLLPITEVVGRTVWYERLRDLVEDIFRQAAVETAYGRLPASDTEVNGNMLQVLSRLFAATGQRRYLEWAERIGDAYLLEMLPRNNGLPAHRWDFTHHRPVHDLLSLNDHGNEIIGGLGELFVTVSYADPQRAAQYREPFQRMLDTLLEHARNADGLWVGQIQPSTLQVLQADPPDTWGYALNPVYTFYLLTGEGKYRDTVARALSNLNQARYKNWGGADAFADSLESGLVLLNRLPEPAGLAWLEDIAPIFLSKQRENGLVEGWHGDGNYARTALMFALFKTQGCFVEPWREDVQLGAVQRRGALLVQVTVEKPWNGRLHFDAPRHRLHFQLPLNYPRLNEFPEWWTAEPTGLYRIESLEARGRQEDTTVTLGFDLQQGLPLAVPAGQAVRLRVTPYLSPPAGPGPLEVKASDSYACDGEVDYCFTLHNRTLHAQRLMLTADWGRLSSATCLLRPGQEREVTLQGKLQGSRQVHLNIQGDAPLARIHLTVSLLALPGLVDFVKFHQEEYRGVTYQWTGRGPIERTLQARRGQRHRLELLWGCKNDTRHGVVSVNGRELPVSRQGYDGFEWVTLEIPAETVKSDTLTVRIAADEVKSGAPFVAEIRLFVVPG